MAAQKTRKVKKTIAQFTGHWGTRRVITAKDQGSILGVDEKVGTDLIWEKGNSKVDVTDVHPDVVEHLKKDKSFKVSETEVDITEDDSQ